MDLITGFRGVFISVWLLLFTGNANAQAGGGGVAIGMGLGGDFMMDTAFGELPNPLVTMAAQNGQQPTGAAASPLVPPAPAQPTGGGFNVRGFSTLGSEINTLFPIDASRIAGIANGQTIYLPGFLGNHLHSGSRVVLPVESTIPSSVDQNQQYVLQNEEFTALGNIGHLVRVPVPNASSSNSASSNSASSNASSSDTTISSSFASDGTITIDPKDIIGVADMNMMGPDGNPQFFSFNPGSGHASELSALQSALQGTAVDMADMIPPPFDTGISLADPLSASNKDINTSSTSTVTTEITSVDVITIENSASSSDTSSNETHAATNAHGIDKVLAIDGTAMTNIDGSIMGVSNTHPNIYDINEQSMFDTGGLNMQSMQDTNEQSVFNTGSATSSMNLNDQSMVDTNEQSMFSTGGTTSNINSNEKNIINTLEQSIFDTGASGSIKSNEQSVLNTGSATVSNLNEQTMRNSLEQSMLDIGTSSSMTVTEQSLLDKNKLLFDNTVGIINGNNLKGQSAITNEQSGTHTNEQSMFDRGSAFSGINDGQFISNTNEQSLGSEFSSMNTKEISMLNSGDSAAQSLFDTNDQLMSNNAVNPQGFSKVNKDKGIQTGRNNPRANGQMTSTDEMAMIKTNSLSLKNEKSHSKSTDKTGSLPSPLDSFSTGQNSRGLVNENLNNMNTNEASMFNSVLNANDQSMMNMEMQNANIITNDQFGNSNNQLTKNQINPTNEHDMFNVDTTFAVRKGESNSIGGLFGVTDSRKGRHNIGITGSRFGGMSSQIQTASGDTYLVDSNIGNAGEAFVTLTVDSGNTLLPPKTDTLPGMPSQDHLSDLSTEGLYPFEGSFAARDATLSEGSSAILDMSSVLQGHEPLHIEPSVNIVGEVVTGSPASKPSGNSTGIFAVADIAVDSTTQGIEGIRLTDRGSIRVGGSNPSGIVSLEHNAQLSEQKINNKAAEVSFVSNGENINTLAIDKVNDYVGVENTKSIGQKQFAKHGISIDLIDLIDFDASMKENTSKMTNNGNTLTREDKSILNASHLPLTSLNESRKGLMVAGNNNNDINTFNTLDTTRNVVNNKITTITDGVDVAMSGFSGAPITNMVGVIPGERSGGLAVTGISVPSVQSTSTSASNDFSSSLSQEFTGSTTDNTGFPTGSFVIGAGQPNSKIIAAGRKNSSALASNIGGVALGSAQSPGLSSISLPASAFTRNEKLNQDRLNTGTASRRPVKVDMSNFIPPPYEESKSILAHDQVKTTHRVGSTTDLIKNALNRQNKHDRFNNRLLSNTGSPFSSRSDTNLNNRVASKQDISSVSSQSNQDSLSDRGLSSQDISSGGSLSSMLTSSANAQVQGLQREGVTNDVLTNIAVPNRQNSNGGFNDRVDFHNTAAFASRFNSNRNNLTPSIQDFSTGGRMRLTDTPSTKSRISTEQGSSIVKSNEHFGIISEANILPKISSVRDNPGTATPNYIEQPFVVPSVVVDHAIFTDMARDANAKSSANSVAAALDIHTNTNQALDSLAVRSPISKPIVGSIFGTGANSPRTLTQKFLEKSGITREPAVDFMTTFLQNAKPTRAPGGNNNVQIVPLSNFSPKSDNIITGRQSDAQTVDQFGVADIYTRKQQLNPSQWQQLMSKVSHDPKTGQMTVDVDYQTQNVIGASETKPLNGNINAGSAHRPSSSAFSSELAQRRLSENTGRLNMNSRGTSRRQNNIRSSILFEAPGMTGHKSVTIRNYTPRPLTKASHFSSVQSSIKSPSDIGQNLQEFVGSQTTAERTSSFANTFKQNQQVGSFGVPISQQTNGMAANAMPSNDRVGVDPQGGGQLGETGQKIQNEMNTFKLGRSILISDGVIPEFTGPNSVHSLPIASHDLNGITVNGMRLGQPAVVPQGGSLGSINNAQSISPLLQAESEMTSTGGIAQQETPRVAPGAAVIDSSRQAIGTSNRNTGVPIGGGLSNDISSGFRQSQQNIGFVDNAGLQNIGVVDHFGRSQQSQQGLGFGVNKDISIGLPKSNQNIGIAIRGDLDTGLSITSEISQGIGPSMGSQQANQNTGSAMGEQLSANMTNTGQRSLDTATILGLNDALKKQPMEPTLFTSGSRFAVFGRAGDVTGREVSGGNLAKPVPARRMGVLGPVHDCRYKPDPSSEYYFIYKNGITQHRFRCALGTAFDEMTCECSIRVSDHGDCLEVHMDFNNGVVEDSSLNRLPIGNDNVEITNTSGPIAGIALYGGDGKLTIWRYQNYDFRDHVMLKVQFRPGVGGDRFQPLITNCDSSATEPSLGIIYDNMMQEVILLLKTVNDTLKELRFKVNPNEWNDVTFIYDGQEFIGIVNGVRRYVSRENPHLLGIIGGEIKSTPTHGLVEIRDAAIVLGHCPMYGYYRGAMVDIQIYTCIPKDFRLE